MMIRPRAMLSADFVASGGGWTQPLLAPHASFLRIYGDSFSHQLMASRTLDHQRSLGLVGANPLIRVNQYQCGFSTPTSPVSFTASLGVCTAVVGVKKCDDGIHTAMMHFLPHGYIDRDPPDFSDPMRLMHSGYVVYVLKNGIPPMFIDNGLSAALRDIYLEYMLASFVDPAWEISIFSPKLARDEIAITPDSVKEVLVRRLSRSADEILIMGAERVIVGSDGKIS